MSERDDFLRDCAVLLEDMARYMDLLERLEENPPKETLTRTPEKVAAEVLQKWYPQRP